MYCSPEEISVVCRTDGLVIKHSYLFLSLVPVKERYLVYLVNVQTLAVPSKRFPPARCSAILKDDINLFAS